MKLIADFHIHSKYSRATSPSTDLENLDKWAKIKGVNVLGTGDFTHPLWFKEIKEKLESAEPGLFKLRNLSSPTRFILTSEISCIYSKNKKVRKVHIIVFAPSFEAVEKINIKLGQIGNLKSDGRPILGLDVKELTKIILDADKDCLVIPAHAWTPWFSVFGSKSGFDSLEECFEDYTKYIYAIETGLSSNPAMNWRLSQLDNITLISNSDCHSPQKIGREANVFDTDLSYYAITDAIKQKDQNKFLYTIEFFPEEGKYHFDGHRSCDISFSPAESKKYNNICPKCKKPLTIGVFNRIEDLADRPDGFIPKGAIPFKSLIPLEEIIADSLGMTTASKKVFPIYEKLIKNLGNEFNVLLESGKEDLEKNSLPKVAEGIIKVRNGEVSVKPGYDGVYGKIKIFDKKIEKTLKQKPLL
jgi:uncharacterized protein (TIGR00375 family)